MLAFLSASPFADVLLAPHERALWPIVALIAYAGALGLWLRRRKLPDAADTEAPVGPEAD